MGGRRAARAEDRNLLKGEETPFVVTRSVELCHKIARRAVGPYLNPPFCGSGAGRGGHVVASPTSQMLPRDMRRPAGSSAPLKSQGATGALLREREATASFWEEKCRKSPGPRSRAGGGPVRAREDSCAYRDLQARRNSGYRILGSFLRARVGILAESHSPCWREE